MLKSLLAAAALVAAFASSAPAAVVSWTATLDQLQEVPVPVAVPGAAGTGMGRLNTVSGLLKWTITWENLSGAPVGAHFHAPAAPGITAPVVVNIGNISGLISPTIGSTVLPAIGVSNFLAGLYYINIHTSLNPAGEIRGQVSVAPVPVPAAAALLLTAVAGLTGLSTLRRRRNART
jgi:hypothetical protein